MMDRAVSPAAASRHGPVTLVDVLRARAAAHPDALVYTFLSEGEDQEARLTAGALDARARGLAAWLQGALVAGERVLLLIPPGLAYIEALFGALYAGAVAVPAYPPRPHRSLSRLRSLLREAQPAVVLTTASILSGLERHPAGVIDPGGPRWLAVDGPAVDGAGRWSDGQASWRPPEVGGQTLALLQYTSGSTGEPRGVMLTHANLLDNLATIRRSIGVTSASRGVCWLPPYHDMGLVGGILQPLYAGCSTVLMSPNAFLRRPLGWLEAIARERATINGGPTFAYELCVRTTTPQQRAGLDLSGWEVAFVGAEPVHAETLDRFASAFGPAGFRPAAFRPVYGLAEATLMVSGGRAAAPPRRQDLRPRRARARSDRATAAVRRAGAQARRLRSAGRGPPGDRGRPAVVRRASGRSGR